MTNDFLAPAPLQHGSYLLFVRLVAYLHCDGGCPNLVLGNARRAVGMAREFGPKIIHFDPVFLWCSSYVHRRKRFTMQRTHLNIVATLETSIGRLPANIDAERSILGAVLLDNHAFNDAAEH